MELSAEQAAIRETVREVAVEEIRPTAAEADRTETFPEGVWETLAELDVTALTVPEEYGGFDADRLTYALVNEQVAYGSLAVATALSVHSLVILPAIIPWRISEPRSAEYFHEVIAGSITSCLAEFASETRRERWLPEMATGSPVGAFALSEPDAGSNPAEMSTVARREGDEYVPEGAMDVTNEAIQIHGGYGYVEGDVERFYRDAKVTTIYEGTTQIHTAGYNFVEIFGTPGCRNSPGNYSRQYHKTVIARELLG